MAITVTIYATKYANKPNAATGRDFWYDSEVAQAEGCSEALVGEIRTLVQDCYAKKITDPAVMERQWATQQAAKAQKEAQSKVKINVVGEATPLNALKLVDLLNALEARFKLERR